MTTLSKEEQEAAARKRYIERNKMLGNIIQPVPLSTYSVDIEISKIQEQLDRYNRNYGLNLLPDFQRGHVWTVEQQIAFVEAIIKRTVGLSGLVISFNCPDFGGNGRVADSDLSEMVCLDGLQRLTALKNFVDGKFKIFKNNSGGVDLGDGVDIDFFNGSEFTFRNRTIKFQTLFMQYKADILDYYIAFNSGGTIHSDEEIARVKELKNNL